jgi:glycosyltransferase involved in cell wall biosynthesis
VVAARNAVQAHARGRFIAWMDSDDRSDKTRLAKQVAFLNRHPAIGAVGTAVRYADRYMRPYRTQRYSRDPRRQAVDPQICCATIMARRDVAQKARFRKAFQPGREDGDWLLQLATRRHHNIDDVLYTYRQHESTSKRAAGAVRRLGVLARYGARLRRAGRPDPIDALVPDSDYGYLSDSIFLECAELTAEEKVTALSVPLPGHSRLVSILVPHLYGARFFPHCLQHLAKQTFQNFELLAYDDGSEVPLQADDVRAVLGDIPVRIERGNESRGAAFARSRLLERSEATFIAWQDADDYSRETCLEAQVRYLLAHPDCNAVGTAINYLNGTVVTRSEHYRSRAIPDRHFSVCYPAYMLRTAAAEEAGHCSTASGNAPEDVELLSRIEPYGSVHSIGDILCYRRPNGHGTTEQLDSLEADASHLLTQHLEGHGITPLVEGDASPRHVRDQFHALMRLRRVRIDGTPQGHIYVRMALRDMKHGKRSPLSLIPLGVRFPRGVIHAAAAFARHRLLDRLQRSRSVRPSSVQRGHVANQVAKQLAIAPPTVLRQRPAGIVASCWDCWGDLDEALLYLTPGGRGVWGDVAFVRETAFAPDWHVIFNSPGANAVDITTSPSRVIFAIGEPPISVHRPLHAGQGEDTIVLTSDEELAQLEKAPRRYLLAPTMTRSWWVKKTYDELRATSVTHKPRQLSWITSDLALLPGHRYRLDFLTRLRREVKFDLFGRGYRPIANKWESLAPYHYSIAFENARASYYFTEKLMDCFVAETMPLYFGSPDIERFFPAEAMVLIDPEDPDLFEKIKDVVASDRWERSRDAIREAKHLVLEKYNTFARLSALMKNASEPPLPPRTMRIEPVAVDFGAAT